MELKWQILDEKLFNTASDDLVVNSTRYLSASKDLTLSTNSSGRLQQYGSFVIPCYTLS